MEISIFTIKLFLTLIPGALSTMVFYKLSETHKVDNKFIKFIQFTLLFNLIIYFFVLFIYANFININIKIFEFNLNDYTTQNILNLYIMEVFVSFIIGVFAAFIENRKWIIKLFKKIGVTYKYGDESLIEFFLNSPNIGIVDVILVNENLIYRGIIEGYNLNSNIVELILNEVTVYDYVSGSELDKIDFTYISKEKSNIIIEKPNLI